MGVSPNRFDPCTLRPSTGSGPWPSDFYVAADLLVDKGGLLINTVVKGDPEGVFFL